MNMSPEILIVDDNPRMTGSIAAMLSARGYRTQTTNDPLIAIDLITSDAFGIVLIDIMMPGMTGFDVIDRINGNRETTEFIIISGDQSPEATIKAIRKGAFDFIRKPFEPDELIKRVENAVTQLRLKAERRNAVDALNRLNAQLENAVSQRTAELMETNKQLNLEIQEKRRIERSLRASERKYSNLVNNSPDIIYMLDPEGRFSFVGGAVEKLLRYSPDELIGQHYSSLTPVASEPDSEYRINERRTGERATRAHEIKLLPKTGACPVDMDKPAIFELYASGVYESASGSEESGFIGTYGVARDITERKHAVRALRQSEERFRELAELLPEMLIEIDPAGRLAFFNKKTVASTGYPPDLLATNFRVSELIAPEDRERFEKACQEALKKADVSDQEFVLCTADGHSFPVIMRSTPLSENGAPKGIRALLINITEIKRTREILRATMERAEIASRAKSEFLANMSHEIRTPLNGIIGVCDLLASAPMDRKQREYVSIIQSSGKSLLGLINDILDFSKIEAGKLDFEKIPFEFRSVIDEVADMFLDRMLKKHIEMVVDVGNMVPDHVVGDPLRLRQVLTNLMSNAVKFTDQGEIHITVGVRAASKGNFELLFEVSDTGVGIAPEVQASIFDAFTQADGSTTRKYGGTGLGLAISKRIVEMMGGRIWLRSEPGSGSRFLFTAVLSEAAENPGRSRKFPSTMKDLRILVVEDNPYTLDVIKRMVEGFGCRTEGALTGEDALSRCQDANNPAFDLILLDLELPGLDGIAVAKQLKQTETTPAIIIVSSTGRDRDIKRAEAAGVDSYLVKPIKQSHLLDAMMEICGHDIIAVDHEPYGVEEKGELSGTRILLVEDNPINRRVAKEILKLAGIVVETAENGREAIDKLAQCKIDAILMDIQMPELDGLSATRAIREDIANRDTPIIAMTAHAMQGDRERCLDAGMNDYVSKPIDRKELFATLRRHIHRADPNSAIADPAQPPPPIAALPGLNIAEGMDRLGADLELFLDIVSEYCDNYRDVETVITSAISTGDYKQAERTAHSLKGASGNISATDLYQHSCQLERSCRERNEAEILDLSRKVATELSRLREIQQQLKSDDVAD